MQRCYLHVSRSRRMFLLLKLRRLQRWMKSSRTWWIYYASRTIDSNAWRIIRKKLWWWSLRISKNLNGTNTGQHLWRWNALPPRQSTARGKARSFPRIQTKGVAKERYAPPHHDSLHHSDHRKGPFTRRIAEYSIPLAFIKPPKLETYDSTADPDEHIEHLDTVLD